MEFSAECPSGDNACEKINLSGRSDGSKGKKRIFRFLFLSEHVTACFSVLGVAEPDRNWLNNMYGRACRAFADGRVTKGLQRRLSCLNVQAPGGPFLQAQGLT